MDWGEVLRGALIGAVAGGVGSALFFGLAILVLPRRRCPDCQYLLPRFRVPKDSRQALWGGWTCPECGCQVDRKGRKIEG